MSFTSTDAMILYSIYREKTGVEATLKGIIAFVDYINHDILTFETLNSSLHKLNEVELIKISQSGIATTPVYKKWRTSHFKNKKSVSVYKEMKEIEIYLNKTEAPPSLISVKEDLISNEKFQQAVADYLGKK